MWSCVEIRSSGAGTANSVRESVHVSSDLKLCQLFCNSSSEVEWMSMRGPRHWLPICFALHSVGSENIAGRRQSGVWGLCFFFSILFSPKEVKCKAFSIQLIYCAALTVKRKMRSSSKAGFFDKHQRRQSVENKRRKK